MKGVLTILLFLITLMPAKAQLSVSKINYKILASAQADSLVAELSDSSDTEGSAVEVRQPSYLGGTSALKRKLDEAVDFSSWKKKKAGTYKIYVTKNWREVSVSADTKKAKDLDLVKLAAAAKSTSHLWSSYTIENKLVERYTLLIEVVLVK